MSKVLTQELAVPQRAQKSIPVTVKMDASNGRFYATFYAKDPAALNRLGAGCRVDGNPVAFLQKEQYQAMGYLLTWTAEDVSITAAAYQLLKPEKKKAPPKPAKKDIKQIKIKAQQPKATGQVNAPSVWDGKTYTPDFVWSLLMKISDFDTTNIWRGMEHFDPTKPWETQDFQNEGAGHGDLKACIEVMEKEGKSHEEIVNILVASKKRGLTVMLENWISGDKWFRERALEGLNQLSECVSLAEKNQLSSTRFNEAKWHIQYVNHLERREKEKIMWANLIGRPYSTAPEDLQIISMTADLLKHIDEAKLPEYISGEERKPIKSSNNGEKKYGTPKIET